MRYGISVCGNLEYYAIVIGFSKKKFFKKKYQQCFIFTAFTATQVSSSELQDVFQETSSNIFQINANGE